MAPKHGTRTAVAEIARGQMRSEMFARRCCAMDVRPASSMVVPEKALPVEVSG